MRAERTATHEEHDTRDKTHNTPNGLRDGRGGLLGLGYAREAGLGFDQTCSARALSATFVPPLEERARPPFSANDAQCCLVLVLPVPGIWCVVCVTHVRARRARRVRLDAPPYIRASDQLKSVSHFVQYLLNTRVSL